MTLLDRDDLAWCEIDGSLIFLDIANDRYFRLPQERNRAALDLLEKSERNRWAQPAELARPHDWIAPARRSCAAIESKFSLPDVARAIWLQKRVERRLVRQSLASVLLNLRSVTTARFSDRPLSSAAPDRIIRSFEQARLLRTATDRCLPRSIALVLALASGGTRARVVIGVKTAPFGAHCWAQEGAEVFNDSVEEVLRYTPILVI